MALCENDRAYVAALYDRWVYQARKSFYWLERMQKQGAPKGLLDHYESRANELLERAWELGVHCDVLTEELRFWKAWQEEEARIACEAIGHEEAEMDDIAADSGVDDRAADFFQRMAQLDKDFTRLGIERSKREPRK